MLELTVTEACQEVGRITGVTPVRATVWNWCHAGVCIPGTTEKVILRSRMERRVRLILKDDLLEFLKHVGVRRQRETVVPGDAEATSGD